MPDSENLHAHSESIAADQDSANAAAASHPPVSLVRLIGLFLRIGATGFGGMMPMLAMIHHYLHEKYNYVDEDEIAEAIAIGQILPGPVAVDTATHIGYTLRGVIGGVLATVAFILPSSVMVIALSPLYFRYQHSPHLAAAMRGIGGVVIGLIAAATWRITRPAVKNWPTGLIAAASFLTLTLTPAHPVWVVVAAGVAGAIFLRPRPGSGPQQGGPERDQKDTAQAPDDTADDPKGTHPAREFASGQAAGGAPEAHAPDAHPRSSSAKSEPASQSGGDAR